MGPSENEGIHELLRWKNARHGMFSPAEFIPVAEDTGLISQLGDWVLLPRVRKP